MEGCEYHSIAGRDPDATPRYLATGTPTCMAANRISYTFDLSGPSMSVDTACSSAMAALHQAVRTLQHGDSKMVSASFATSEPCECIECTQEVVATVVGLSHCHG